MPTYTDKKVSFIQHTSEGVALLRPFSCASGYCTLSGTNLNATVDAEQSEFMGCLNNYGNGMTLFLSVEYSASGANDFELDIEQSYTLKVKCTNSSEYQSVGGVTIPPQAFSQGSNVIRFKSNDILILHKIGTSFTICNYHLINANPVLSSSDHNSSAKYLVNGSGYSGSATKYLKEDGSWEIPTNTTYAQLSASAHASNASYVVKGVGTSTNSTYYLRSDGTWNKPTNTTYAQLSASAHATNKTYSIQGSGYSGSGAGTKFLREDGTWQTVSGGSTYTNLSSSNHNSEGQYTVAGIGNTTNENYYLRSDGAWAAPTADLPALSVSSHAVNVKYAVLGGGDAAEGKFLWYDGSWATPLNTTYNTLSTSDHYIETPYVIRGSGYTGTPTRYLREDGTWQAVSGGGSADAVLYTQQTLSTAQQAQARSNIAALGATLNNTSQNVSFNAYNVVILNSESELPETPSANTIYMIKEA